MSPYTWIFFILGAIIGSFLNVCILRIPAKEFWKHSRSICPSCGEPIPGWLNLPIFSYFILRGKTKCCQKPLSPMYPAVELFTAVLFAVIFWQFPFLSFGAAGLEVDPNQFLRCMHALIFASLLIVCSVIDIRLMIIPDVLSLPMIVATPMIIYLHPELSWKSGMIGVLLGGGSLWLVAWIYWLIRKQVGMGMGDVKLLAAIGGWLGYQSILPTIFYASISGSFIGIVAMVSMRRRDLKFAIPFGPFLALGALIHLLYGMELQELIMGIPHAN